MKISILEQMKAFEWWRNLAGPEKVSVMKTMWPWLWEEGIYSENNLLLTSTMIVELYWAFNQQPIIAI